jgi:ABC-type amino acid transport/signal transduction systems, periplasmic component/domain
MNCRSEWRNRVVFAYIDEPPFATPLSDGAAAGCDVDLALAGLRALGVREVELRLTTFAELLPGVASGRWTMNTPVFVSAERQGIVSFSRPVWALGDGFVVPAGNPNGITSYRTIAEGRHTLALVGGQIQRNSALAAGVAAQHIIEFSTQHEALQAVRGGLADAYASTALGNRTVLERSGQGELMSVDAQDDFPRSPPIGAFSFAHENIDLRRAFDEFLAGYVGSIEHRERMLRNGLTRNEIDPIASWSSTANDA